MGFPDSSASKESAYNAGGPRLDSWVGKIPWKRNRLPTSEFMVFPGGSDGKESACSEGDLGLIPGLGISPGGGKGYQYSGLENFMDYIVHGVAKSWTQLSDFHFQLILDKENVNIISPLKCLEDGNPFFQVL